MKNKMGDVRDHLCAMLESLGDENAEAEKMALTVERAKATALVADKYIQAVKVEIDARARLQGDNLPPALSHDRPALQAVASRR